MQTQTAVAAGDVRAALTDFENAMQESDPEGTAPAEVPEWLAWLPPVGQRRLLLLALEALTSIASAVDAETGIEQPAHLDQLVLALLAIAFLLSEWLEQRSE